MKKVVIVLITVNLALSCNDGKVSEKKIDEAGDKLQKTVKKGADSLMKKAERLKDSLVKDDEIKN